MTPEVQQRIVDGVVERMSPMGELPTFGLMVTLIVAMLIIVIFMASIRSVGNASKDGMSLLVKALATAADSSREVALEMRELRSDLRVELATLSSEVGKLHLCIDTLKELSESVGARRK